MYIVNFQLYIVNSAILTLHSALSTCPIAYYISKTNISDFVTHKHTFFTYYID